MIITSAEFVKSAVKPSHYPPATLPEIAFAGRSNVGKSSLINCLVNRKRLVKTSSTPGRTRLINFFKVNDRVYFVDLPGYGYAKVPVSIRKRWGPMIETYLSGRKSLVGLILIMDIRRIPGPEETRFMDWLDLYRISRILTLTKTDKLSKTKQILQRRRIADALRVSESELHLFSAKTAKGRDVVQDKIETLIGDDPVK